MSSNVQYSIRDSVAWIVMDRPQAMNASNMAMKDALMGAFTQAEREAEVRVLVLTGNGRAFCAGGDRKEPGSAQGEAYRARIQKQQALCRAIWDVSKPVIAAINGHALGGGLEMALMCDIRLAAKSAVLGTPVTRIGSISTGGLHSELARIVGHGNAMHMLLTADPVDAVEALRIGLVTALFEDETFQDDAQRFAQRIAGFPARSVVASKKAFRRSCGASFETVLTIEEDLAVALHRQA